MALIDSYDKTNSDGQSSLYNGSNTQQAQSFTCGYNANITSAKFEVFKSGSPTGSAYAYLYSHSGTYGTSSVPTGAALATSDAVDVTGLGTSTGVLVEFTFSGANQYLMSASTYYCIAIGYSGGNSSNYLRVRRDSSSPSHGGNFSNYDGSWAANNGRDLSFYVYGNRVFTQSLTGSLVSTGNLIKKTNKFITGLLTLSGIINKAISKLVSGIINFTGLLDTLYISGGHVYNQACNGSLTFTGLVSKLTSKNILGQLDSTGSIIKFISKNNNGTLTLTGTLNKAISISVLGTLALTGIANKQINKVLQGSINFTGNIIKLINKVLTGILNFTVTENEILRPNGNGDSTEWNPGTDNYLNVDEETADDSSSYNNTITTNKLDLYTIPDFSGIGTINKITVYAKILSGSESDYARIAIKTGGTVYYSDNLTTTVAVWESKSKEWSENPDTSSAWTWDDINSLQIGIEGNASSYITLCTQIYVEINYTHSAGILKKDIYKYLQGNLVLTGIANKLSQQIVNGAISFTGLVLKQVNKILTGQITFLSNIQKLTGKNLTGTQSLSGNISKDISKNLTGSFTSTGTISKLSAISINGLINFSNFLNKITYKNITGVIRFHGWLRRLGWNRLVATATSWVNSATDSESWTDDSKDSENWSAVSKDSESWSEIEKDSQSWTETEKDTQSWVADAKDTETWT